MNCEVVAVGTELLLGGGVDTNSAWIGERLAEVGIDSFFHTAVGDNEDRMVHAIGAALQRSDAVIVTGGLGPTQDDITREATARVLGVDLEFDAVVRDRIASMFNQRGRKMSKNNERQAMRPVGSRVIEQVRGTAPGLICEAGDKVIYLLPGVPFEMKEMTTRAVLPDLVARSGRSDVIISRTLRTWGKPEATVAEMVAPRFEALDLQKKPVTIAFLAHSIEGIHVRITVKASSVAAATKLLDEEETELRLILGGLVFGTDDQSMEHAVAALLADKQLSLAVAESLTGGLVASRLTDIPGGSSWFRGGIVSYASDTKFDVLDVPEGPVVTAVAACAMAGGVRRVMGADIGVAVTGVAGPTRQEDQPVGLVHGAIAMPGCDPESFEMRLFGDRTRIRNMACINMLDALRHRLLHA